MKSLLLLLKGRVRACVFVMMYGTHASTQPRSMGLWQVLWVPALPTDIYRERERKYTAAMRVLGIVCSMTHLVAFLGNCTIGIFVLVAHTHKQIRVVCVGAIS